MIKYIRMTANSNFWHRVLSAVASAFLPFLPMLPLQLLVQNLLPFLTLRAELPAVHPRDADTPATLATYWTRSSG
jgi:hypothetical protein